MKPKDLLWTVSCPRCHKTHSYYPRVITRAAWPIIKFPQIICGECGNRTIFNAFETEEEKLAFIKRVRDE